MAKPSKPTTKKRGIITPSEKTKVNPNPTFLRTVSANGTAPESRFQNAEQVFRAAREMVEADNGRMKKRARVYKAYKRFPPTDYSSIVDLRHDGSNVNWGMLQFMVDSQMTSFYDMVAERPRACNILTKKGRDAKEKEIFSDYISDAYDRYALREDENFLAETEMDLMDLGLFGKGIQMYDDMEGYQSEHCPVSELYVPEDTRLNFSEWDCFCRKRSYKLHKVWDMIKNKGRAEEMGWSVEATIYAMRSLREDWRNNYHTNEQFLKGVAQGRVSLSSVMKERLHVFDFYVLEYDGTISRFIVMQNYSDVLALVNEKDKSETGSTEDTACDEMGFLYCKMKYAENIREILSVFIDRAGSGMWHDTPSFAESIFVQCRQYDITMNRIMDAIAMNMTLLLQGQTEEATQRLKDVVWGQWAILPAGMPFVQQRTQLDTQVATMSLQFMMSDLYSGIGAYRVQEKDKGGDQPTATQRQLDAAESAKLKGTQISRYNERQTIFHRQKFERFIRCKSGMKGFENFEKFRECLREYGVPDAAWNTMDNIESVSSNMLAGAGSPSYKLMVAEKIISFTNLVPKDEGQRAAIEDAIAALAGRQAVKRYLSAKIVPDPTWKDREIGLECEAFESAALNPQNLQVYPNDDHVRHIPRHLGDMATTVVRVEKAIQDGTIDESLARPAMTRLQNEGAHVTQHIKMVQSDESKMPYLKEWNAQLMSLQRAIGKISQNMQKILDQKGQQGGQDRSQDPDIMKAMSLAQIQVDTAQKLAQITLTSAANKAQVDNDIAKEKASVEVAAKMAKSNASAPKPTSR